MNEFYGDPNRDDTAKLHSVTRRKIFCSRKEKTLFFKTALPCAVFFTVIYLLQSDRTASPQAKDVQSVPNLARTRKTYRILFWHSFPEDFFNTTYSDDMASKCAFPCKFTQDRKQLNASHVVVLLSFFSPFWESQPPFRKPSQAWMLYALEPPHRLPPNASKMDTLAINWTISYRLDADVVLRHSFKTVRLRFPRLTSAPDPKPKPLAWIVSNCNAYNKREKYVKELRKTVPVDIYGKCGRHRCRAGQFGCYKEIAGNYSFYLAFENSICKDYSTEKLFHPLLNGMVPIVMGGVDYSAVAPPGSYIDFSAFRTPRELGEYILQLQKSPEAYKQYFIWKRDYAIERPLSSCLVCEQIHGLFSAPVKRPPRSLYKYLWQDSKCTNWKDMLKRKWSQGYSAP